MRPPSRQRRHSAHHRQARRSDRNSARRRAPHLGCPESTGITINNIYYSETYTAAAHEFDTTRKAGWIVESLVDRPIAGIRLGAPDLLTEEQLNAVHSREYVNAVKTGVPRHLAETNGFRWDPAMWDAVRASNGGAVAAALHALSTRSSAGSLSSGLHHARRNSGFGFCTFNGVALAARSALDAGARRVLILDLDAHVGDGTIDIIRDWTQVTHVDIAVSAWGADAGDPSRSSRDVIASPGDYLPTLERRLAALDGPAFHLCIYNAGMDPHEDCDLGGLEGMTTDVIRKRERMVFAWAASVGVPVAFVLAGGYVGGTLTRDALVDLHRITIMEAAGITAPPPKKNPTE
jgi:acetoin utilization deacetylase AcuC-like enzyme